MRNILTLKIHKFCLMALVLFATIGCDQATKVAAKDLLRQSAPVHYLGDTFRFQYTENSGAFLSLGSALSERARFWIFTVAVAAVLVAGFVHLLISKLDFFMTLGWALMLGGGLGNLVDRVRHGTVVDFMNLGIGNLRTGVFNVADLAIVVGGLFVALHPWLGKGRSSKSTRLCS
jgi:signal peptidase II